MSTKVVGTVCDAEAETSRGLRSTLSRNALKLQSDDRLVELCRSGCERAFEAIDQRYRPQLVRYCTPMLGADRAQDIAQQTLTQAYTTLRTDDRPIKLRYWLLRVAHNFSIDALRKKGSAYEQLDDNFDGVPQPPAVIEQRDKLGTVLAQIDTLPERQRVALLLREFEGRSYDEIASELGASRAVVSQLLQRARTRLRDAAGTLVPMPILRVLASRGGEAGSQNLFTELASNTAASSPGLFQAGAAALAVAVMTLGGAAAMQQAHAAGTVGGDGAVTAANVSIVTAGGAQGDNGLIDQAGPTPVGVSADGAGPAGADGSSGAAGDRADAKSAATFGPRAQLKRVIRSGGGNAPKTGTAKQMLTGRALHDQRQAEKMARRREARRLKNMRRGAAYERKIKLQREHRTGKKERQQARRQQRGQKRADRIANKYVERQVKNEQRGQRQVASQERRQAARDHKQAVRQERQQASQDRKRVAQQRKQAAREQKQTARQQNQALKQQKKAAKKQAKTVAP